MTWFETVPTVFAGLFVLFAPGALLGALLGLRRLWLWALAPVFSTTLLMTGSLVLPLFGLAWNPLTAFGFASLFGAAIFFLYKFLLRTTLRDTKDGYPSSAWAAIAGWGISAVVLATYAILGIGAPENISQTFDNIFHLNALAYIGETGTASPLGIGELVAPGSDSLRFYPLAWHALAQLAQSFTGASVAVATNAFNLAVVISVWPVGVMLLTRQLVGKSSVVTLAAGVLSAAFPAFPLNLLFYGVLYPYLLGLAFVPVVLAVVLQILGITRDDLISSKPGLVVLLAGILPAISLAHPSATMTVLAFSVPAVLVAFFAGWRVATNRARLWRVLGLGVYGAAGLALVYKLRPGDVWGPRTTFGEALYRTVTLSLEGYGVPVIMAALVVLGIVIAARSRSAQGIAAIGIWAVAASLHLVTAGASRGIWRGITGVWYGDAPRLAAILPIAAVPLAAMGVHFLVKAFSGSSPSRKRSTTVAGIVLALVVLGTQLTAGYGQILPKMNESYRYTKNSMLLSTDEHELLQRLADQIAPGDLIVGNPWTGTSLALAFSDRPVIMPHILIDLEGDRRIIMDSLIDAQSNPEVCQAVGELNARWILDFGPLEVHGANHEFAGLEDIELTKLVELVDQEGDARLYRIVACQ